MVIPQAFDGEAGTAEEAGVVGQGREVILQQRPSFRLDIQYTVTETSCVGLQDDVRLSAGTSALTSRCVYSGRNNPVIGLWEIPRHMVYASASKNTNSGVIVSHYVTAEFASAKLKFD